MLSGAASKTRSSLLTSSISDSGFLPVLYCTRTILRPFAQYRRPRPRIDGRDVTGSGQYEAGKEDGEDGGLSDHNHEKGPQRQKHTHRRREEKNQFGRNGFKVNEPWESVWKHNQPSRPSEIPPQETDDDSYTPFVEWSGPSSDSVSTKTPKKIHRDTSHVPFERPQREVREDPHADLEGTTITPSEKKAFESLFELYNPSAALEASPTTESPGEGVDNGGPNDKPDNRIRKITPKMGDASKQPYRTMPEMPEPLEKLRRAAMASRLGNTPSSTGKEQSVQTQFTASNKRHRSKTDVGDSRSERVDRLAEQDVYAMKRKMLAQDRDTRVWTILHNKVLNSILSLELDGARGAKSKKRKEVEALKRQKDFEDKDSRLKRDGTQSEPSLLPDTRLQPMGHSDAIPSDGDVKETITTHLQPLTGSLEARTLQTLSRSVPQHLINAFTILTDHFPASPLPLNLIPLVKSLGPSTAALCLSTRLYNLHIQHHWDKYRDPLAICDILQEMDDNVYEFDRFTWTLTMNILHNVWAARRGELGVAAQAIAGMDGAVQGGKRLNHWTRIMRERWEAEMLKGVREREAMEIEHKEEDEKRNRI